MSVPPAPKKPLKFKPLMKEAPALPAWPPAGYRGFYKVSDKPTMNWQSVAWSWGVPDPWDLIWFNFRTDDPWKVNFYMHRYLGCTESNDGKNFSFRDAERGFVYIPPLNWKRPHAPIPLGIKVAEALGRLAPYFPPYVTFYNVHVSRTDLLSIVEALRTGRIVVRHDPTLTRAAAEYDRHSEPEELILSSKSLIGLENRRTLVHEAVHAILDMKGYTLRRWQNEFIAYAVEAQFTFSKAPSAALRMLKHKPANIIHAEAIMLASFTDADLRKGKASIRLEDYNRLFQVDATTWTNPFSALQWALRDHVPNEHEIIKGDGI